MGLENLAVAMENLLGAWNRKRAKPEFIECTAGLLHSKPSMSGEVFDNGTLTDGTAVDVPMAGAPLPCTVTLDPASGDAVQLEYSSDGIKYDVEASVSIRKKIVFDAPIIALRITRTAGTGITSTWAVA